MRIDQAKKTLFKCCFAIAVHRLAAEIGALLPTLLIIDSPMKNISERENREQFEGFFELLYQLASDELRDTQFILIDKELCPPPTDFERVGQYLFRDSRTAFGDDSVLDAMRTFGRP